MSLNTRTKNPALIALNLIGSAALVSVLYYWIRAPLWYGFALWSGSFALYTAVRLYLQKSTFEDSGERIHCILKSFAWHAIGVSILGLGLIGYNPPLVNFFVKLLPLGGLAAFAALVLKRFN